MYNKRTRCTYVHNNVLFIFLIKPYTLGTYLYRYIGIQNGVVGVIVIIIYI